MLTLPTREMLGSQTVKNKQQITIGIDMPTIVTTVIIRKLVSISLIHSQYVQLGKVLFILIRSKHSFLFIKIFLVYIVISIILYS